MNEVVRASRRALRRARAALDGFAADDCAFLAGAVAYQFFFAIVPLLALAIGVLGFVYGTDRASRELAGLLRQVYPIVGGEEMTIVRQLAEGRTVSLGLGLLGTLFSVTAIHGSLDAALASVLGRKGERSLVRGKLEALAFASGLLLLAILSFTISYGVQALQEPLAALGMDERPRLALELVSPLVGALPAFAFFYGIYRFVPRVAVGERAARVGALVATVLWEAAKVGFGFYTRALSAFTAYGTLAFVAGLLTWIYLTAVVILVGAEVVKSARRGSSGR